MNQARPAPDSRTRTRGTTILVLGLTLLTGLAVGRATADLKPWPKPHRPDIVLLTVDTLRSDHLPFYGYHRNTAPFLASLAAEGVVFENATSTSSWTSPSVASLVTSLYPHQHGVETTAAEEPTGAFSQAAISHEVTTIAENMKKLGYGTFGVVTNMHIAHDLGFAQGFDHFVNVGFTKSGEPVYNGVLEISNQLLDTEPYFLWVHLFDPHAPYRIVEPYISEFDAESGTRYPLIAEQDDRARERRFRKWANKQLENIEKDEATIKNPIVVETLKNLYDAELRDTDDWIERIFSTIDVDEDTIVFFTADHGEEFRDHGNLGHRNTLHAELTHVPMMIWAPEHVRKGARVQQATSLVDVLPTLVAAAGGAHPEGVQGMSLWDLARSGTPLPERDLLLGVHNAKGDQRAVVRYPLKLIERPDGEVSLFDLSVDPTEQHDVAQARPGEAIELRDAMRSAYAGLPRVQHAKREVRSSEAEMLKAMGYVEGEEGEGAPHDEGQH